MRSGGRVPAFEGGGFRGAAGGTERGGQAADILQSAGTARAEYLLIDGKGALEGGDGLLGRRHGGEGIQDECDG